MFLVAEDLFLWYPLLRVRNRLQPSAFMPKALNK